MAAKVMSATSAAVNLPEVTALCVIFCASIIESVGAASFCKSVGRVRCEVLIPVGTNAGHNTEQPMGAATPARSWNKV